MLQAAPWEVEVVEAVVGRDALSQLGAGAMFDAVVVDMHMPDIDGVELARRIRGIAPALPLVLSTSFGNRELAADDADLFAAHLAKPVRSSQLFDTLIGVLAGSARIAMATHVDQQLVARSGNVEPVPAADPARRGQRGEPEARHASARANGISHRCRVERARGGRVGGSSAVRRGVDGRPDARARRSRSHSARSSGPTRRATGRPSSP